MLVEPFVQVLQNNVADNWIRIGDANREQLVQNVADDFNGMAAGLVTDGVFNEQRAAGLGGGGTDLCIIILQVWKCTGADKLIEDMT